MLSEEKKNAILNAFGAAATPQPQPLPSCSVSLPRLLYQLNALQPQRNCENETTKKYTRAENWETREAANHSAAETRVRDFQLKGIAALCGFLCLLASLSCHPATQPPCPAAHFLAAFSAGPKTTRKPCTFGNQFLLLLPLLCGG